MRFDCQIAQAAPTPAAAPGQRSNAWLAVPLTIFAVVSLTVGLVARQYNGGSYGGYFRLFFTDPIHLKAWFATAAALLACTQLFTAAWIFRRFPIPKPPWVNLVHRNTGRLAFVCTLPVAYHCIFKLGFQTYSTRVWVHSLLGCAFFGAYFAKVTIVRLHRFPRWVLPVAGSTLFTILIAVWYSSAEWFFTNVDSGF